MSTTNLSSNIKEPKAKRQRQLLAHWLPHLSKIQEIDLVWIEGSIASQKRENPGSDIDIRFAIQDHAFDDLWDSNRKKVFEPLGEIYILGPFRIVTERGILIESEAFKTSKVTGRTIFEWEILLNRLPEGQPNFKQKDMKSTTKWPHPQEINLESISEVSKDILRRLSTASTPFYSSEPHSALFELHLLRLRVINILYWRSGITPFMRAKHLEQVFSEDFFKDYEYIQFKEDEYSLDFGSIAKATLRTFQQLKKHTEEIYDQVGSISDYPEKWFQLLYRQLETELQPFIKRGKSPK